MIEQFLPLLGELVAAIVRAGKDPEVEIKRIKESYDMVAAVDRKVDDAIAKKFGK